MNEGLHTELALFREAAEWKEATVGDRTWEYVTGGDGGEWVLLIHGGGGDAESTFRYFANLVSHFRIIAPTLPGRIPTMGEIVEGIVALFDREGIDRAHLFGLSLGSMVARVLACRHPDRVNRCVFSHAGMPQSDQAGALRKALPTLKIMPYFLIRRQIPGSFKKSLKIDIPDIEQGELDFWFSRQNNGSKKTFERSTSSEACICKSTITEAPIFHRRRSAMNQGGGY